MFEQDPQGDAVSLEAPVGQRNAQRAPWNQVREGAATRVLGCGAGNVAPASLRQFQGFQRAWPLFLNACADVQGIAGTVTLNLDVFPKPI